MITSAMAFAAQPNIAIFYAADPPWDELRAFDSAKGLNFNAILKNRNLDGDNRAPGSKISRDSRSAILHAINQYNRC